MGKVFALHHPGDRFQGRADEAIAWRIDGQIIESASHQATLQQLMTLGLQDVDSPAHPVEHRISRSIAEIEPPTLPLLHRVGQDLGNEVRQIVRVLFQPDLT